MKNAQQQRMKRIACPDPEPKGMIEQEFTRKRKKVDLDDGVENYAEVEHDKELEMEDLHVDS